MRYEIDFPVVSDTIEEHLDHVPSKELPQESYQIWDTFYRAFLEDAKHV
jgi:hypothetical protein